VTGTTLAISTSSPALSLALFDADGLLNHDHRLIGRGHAEALLPAIAALLGEQRPAQIVVDVGPGSFTGIRIGIAAARALGLAWGIDVTGCTATGLVAAAAFAAAPSRGVVIVDLDAGRGQRLRQRVAEDFSAGAIETVAGDDIRCAADPDDFPPIGPHSSHNRFVTGVPDAAFVRLLPPAARGLPPQALYIRPPDAILPL
jgi:tRNA threonylcarbamoyl adenosine modification protein YeaZ